MGQPVNVNQLARQLIRLRGKVPDTDIKIEFTGLRPGEKLTEVLSYKNEALAQTSIDGVLQLNTQLSDPASILRRIEKLISALELRDKSAVRKALKTLLPDYTPNGALEEGTV
jgi:O-antigen biosynthesis protein WbqV